MTLTYSDSEALWAANRTISNLVYFYRVELRHIRKMGVIQGLNSRVIKKLKDEGLIYVTREHWCVRWHLTDKCLMLLS